MHRVDPQTGCRPIRVDELEDLPHRHDRGPSALLAYDVFKRGDELVIEFDIPGVDPSSIEVVLEGRTLLVSVNRELAQGDGIDVIDPGRAHGAFSERLLLGNRWDPTGLRARVEHGVLTIRAPLASWQPRSIPVDRGAARSSDGGQRSADQSSDVRISSAA
jgi:HSP20 family protein